MQYAISQLVLDVFGDLLSKSSTLYNTKLSTHCGCSSLHPTPAHLAGETSVDPEICISVFPVPHGCRDHLHRDTSQRPGMAWQTRRSMGSVFPDCGSRSRLNLGFCECFPCPLCRTSAEAAVSSESFISIFPDEGYPHFETNREFTTMDVKAFKGS